MIVPAHSGAVATSKPRSAKHSKVVRTNQIKTRKWGWLSGNENWAVLNSSFWFDSFKLPCDAVVVYGFKFWLLVFYSFFNISFDKYWQANHRGYSIHCPGSTHLSNAISPSLCWSPSNSCAVILRRFSSSPLLSMASRSSCSLPFPTHLRSLHYRRIWLIL